MKGINLAEQGHLVGVLLAPVDITGGKSSDIFHLKNHARVAIVVQIGVSSAAPGLVTVEASADASGTSAETIPFAVYKEETADGDTLGARTAVAATGFTPSANNGIFYVIDILAEELPAGKPYLQLKMANTTNSVIASALAILTGARYGEDQNATAIT